MHTHTRGQVHVHIAGVLGMFDKRHEAFLTFLVCKMGSYALLSPRNCSFPNLQPALEGSQIFFVSLSLSSSLEGLFFFFFWFKIYLLYVGTL